MIRHLFCPRCGCCSLLTNRDGTMYCNGNCDPASGTHDPETAEEWKAVVAERDRTIATLRARLAAVGVQEEAGEQ